MKKLLKTVLLQYRHLQNKKKQNKKKHDDYGKSFVFRKPVKNHDTPI